MSTKIKTAGEALFFVFWLLLSLGFINGIYTNASTGHWWKVLFGAILLIPFAGNTYLWGRSLFGAKSET